MPRTLITANSSYKLLVEGEADRGFFEQVCKLLKLHPEVTVASPKDYQGNWHDGKQAVIRLLPRLLGELLDEEAPTQRLAVVVDADTGHGLGFQQTLDKISDIAKKYDFILAECYKNGLLFKHIDEVAEFGLWIMPNNQLEGMLEDFVKRCIRLDEQTLFQHAEAIVANLPSPKFKPIHQSKAEIATWLAWQKDPGHGLYMSVKDALLDQNSELFLQLSAWLRHIYP